MIEDISKTNMNYYMYMIKNLLFKLGLVDADKYTASVNGLYAVTYNLKLHNNQYAKQEVFQRCVFLTQGETIDVNGNILHVCKVSSV